MPKVKMAKIKSFFISIKGEIRKIIWPAEDEVITGTGTAVWTMLLSAVFIYGLDEIAQLGLSGVLKLFS